MESAVRQSLLSEPPLATNMVEVKHATQHRRRRDQLRSGSDLTFGCLVGALWVPC